MTQNWIRIRVSKAVAMRGREEDRKREQTGDDGES